MSAPQTHAAGMAGKDTLGGIQPSGAASTHAETPVYPHLAYGDAVHAALASAGLPPDVMEAGLRKDTAGGRELFLRLVWLAQHPELGEAVWLRGLIVLWSPVTGWAVRVEDGVEEHLVLLDVDELAAPELVADAARHYATHGMDRPWVIPFGARWAHALELDIALVHFDEQEVLR